MNGNERTWWLDMDNRDIAYLGSWVLPKTLDERGLQVPEDVEELRAYAQSDEFLKFLESDESGFSVDEDVSEEPGDSPQDG